ncbi:hypothetical protein GC176_26795 [bacterium]|nr:hypothetical protein [bacterium]
MTRRCLCSGKWKTSVSVLTRRVTCFAVTAAVLELLFASSEATAAESNEPATIHRLIYLGTSGPLFLKLQLTIDGQPISEFRHAFAARQFSQFDKDGNGSLAPEEAAQVPAFDRSTSHAAVLGDDWKSLDVTPQDGQLSLSEVTDHYEAFMGPAFSLTRRVQDRLLDVDLLGELDADHDRSVSETELKSGPEALRLLDLDDDETISAAELAPLSDPAGRPAFVTETEDSQQAYPFVLLEADANLVAIAEQILRQYDRSPADGGEPGGGAAGNGAASDGELSTSEIPASFAHLVRFDADGSKSLSISELVAALQQPGNDLSVTAEMPKFGRPRITQPELPDRSIDFSVKRGAAVMSDTISFFRIQFLRVDADRNRYLDAQEFGGLNLEGATFEVVDRNGDGQVIVDEIVSYLDERASLGRLRVIMRVDLQRRSLFEILDSDSDLRLTRREFLLGPERIAEFDKNHNRALDASEIESRYRVTIELAQPGLIPNSQMTMQQASTNPRLQEAVSGPEWFRRMDLNRDGEVSRREFLGSVNDFARFDADRDGALTADEAQTAADSAAN